MKEQFEYGELVEVRDFDKREWKERHYVGIMNGRHYVMLWNENPSNFSGAVMDWKQIRKIQKDKTKSPETSPTKKEASQLRDDANWAIEQALTIGHREYGEVVRAAKLIIESQKELINFIGQINQL